MLAEPRSPEAQTSAFNSENIMWFKNFHLYRLPSPWSVTADDLGPLPANHALLGVLKETPTTPAATTTSASMATSCGWLELTKIINCVVYALGGERP